MEDIPFALWQLDNVTVEDIGNFLGMGEDSDVISTNNYNVSNINVNEENIDNENEDFADVAKSVPYGIRGTRFKC